MGVIQRLRKTAEIVDRFRRFHRCHTVPRVNQCAETTTMAFGRGNVSPVAAGHGYKRYLPEHSSGYRGPKTMLAYELKT